MKNWEELKDNIPEMQKLADEYGIRGLAEKLGVSHPAIIYHLNKNTEKKVDKGDHWHIMSDNRSFDISKEQVKAIRKDYCASGLTKKETCANNNLPYWKFDIVKKIFDITHNEPVWTDEELMENSTEELADLALMRQKDDYFNKLQGKKIKRLERQLQKYYDKEYLLKKSDEVAKKFWEQYNGDIPEFTVETVNDEFVLEIEIPDLHLARLSWAAEVGENYDRNKAVERFLMIVEKMISRVQVNIDKIMFVLGHDYTNFDNIDGETTKGTFQDNDSRWQKMIITAQELAVSGIEYMKQHANQVEVIFIPGNHDFSTSYHIIRYIKAYYRNDDRIIVDDSPNIRKYRAIGVNLIGFSHGNNEGKRIFELMHNEVPKLWGQSKYREFHLGHTHTRNVQEKNGITARWIPAATAASSWEHHKGFTSLAGSRGYLWHKTEGLYQIIPIDLI